jgi:prophage regulatory protein
MESDIRMMNVKEVMDLTGLSRTTLWRRVRRGDFPTPRQLGPRRFAWLNTDIKEFLLNLPPVPYAKAEGMNGEVRPS